MARRALKGAGEARPAAQEPEAARRGPAEEPQVPEAARQAGEPPRRVAAAVAVPRQMVPAEREVAAEAVLPQDAPVAWLASGYPRDEPREREGAQRA